MGMKFPKWKDTEDFDLVDYAIIGVLVMFTVSLSFIHLVAGLTTINLFLFAFIIGRKWERLYGKVREEDNRNKKTGV